MKAGDLRPLERDVLGWFAAGRAKAARDLAQGTDALDRLRGRGLIGVSGRITARGILAVLSDRDVLVLAQLGGVAAPVLDTGAASRLAGFGLVRQGTRNAALWHRTPRGDAVIGALAKAVAKRRTG